MLNSKNRMTCETPNTAKAVVQGFNETIVAEDCDTISQYTVRKISNFYALLRRAGHSSIEAAELAKGWFNIAHLRADCNKGVT